MTASPEDARYSNEPDEDLGSASSWRDHIDHARDRAASKGNAPARPPRIAREVRTSSRLGALLAFGEEIDAGLVALSAKTAPEVASSGYPAGDESTPPMSPPVFQVQERERPIALNPLSQEGENK